MYSVHNTNKIKERWCFMNKKKKIFLFTIFVFTLGLLLQFKTYSYEDVYYFDELKVGDFLPNGSTVISNVDYHEKSMHYSDVVYLRYYSYLGDLENLEYSGAQVLRDFPISTKSRDVVRTYQEIYETENFSFAGWIVVGVKNNEVYLEPADEGADIITKPSDSNDYLLEATCIDGTDASHLWYKYEDITQYQIDKGASAWQWNNGEISFRTFNTIRSGYTTKITFTFQANQDSVLYFESRAFANPLDAEYHSTTADQFKMVLDGTEVEIDNHDFYRKNYYELLSDGEHTLEFVFTRGKSAFAYAYFKNLRILTYLGDGEKLDTTLLNNNDKIYYEALCADYKMSGETIVKKEVVEIPEPEDDNPNTFDGISIYLLVISISLLCLFVVRKRSH